MSPLPDRARAELDTLGHDLGLVTGGVLRRTDKSILVAGTLGGMPVVAKLLLDGGDFWRAKLAHEIGVYRTFTSHPPPIRVPRLVHAADARLLILQRLDGRPLDLDRYPTRVLPRGEVDLVLDAVTALHAWQPPEGGFAPVFDHPERISRYRDHGILTETDADALHHLLASWPGRWEINHGDPLPSNILLTDDGDAALLDWEFTGLFLPGFDLALLHTLLAETPQARDRIERTVSARGIEVPFTINLAMVLTREIRTHRELPDGRLRARRLALIEHLWAHARERIQTLAAGG